MQGRQSSVQGDCWFVECSDDSIAAGSPDDLACSYNRRVLDLSGWPFGLGPTFRWMASAVVWESALMAFLRKRGYRGGENKDGRRGSPSIHSDELAA